MHHKAVETIVVDESVSESWMKCFKTFAGKKGLWTPNHLMIAQEHPGMPDGNILHHFLSHTTVFVTSDRPLHNKVLSKGLRSYYINEKIITGKPLQGIRIKPDIVLRKEDLVLKENYFQPNTEIRSLLLPTSEKKLKRLYTKRRRIRNRFGGFDHIDQVALTVSMKSMGAKTLIGIRIRVSSNVGIKAFDASENYIAEKIPSKSRSIASVCHALALLIQLMLHPAKTLVFWDAANMQDPKEYAARDPNVPFSIFFKQLRESFSDLEFIAAPKGKFVEMIRRRMNALAKNSKTNEIVPGDIQGMQLRVSQSL